MDLIRGLKAVANARRLAILKLLADPAAAGRDARTLDTGRRGLTATALRRRIGISQPAMSEQMQVLIDVGFVEAYPMGQWTVYVRDEARIRQFRQALIDEFLV